MKRKIIISLLLNTALTFSFTAFAFVPHDFVHQKPISFKLDQIGTRLSTNLDNATEQRLQKGERPRLADSFRQNGIDLRTTDNFTLPYFEDFERRIGNNLADFGYTAVNYTNITRGVGHLTVDGMPIPGILGSLSYMIIIPNEDATLDMWVISSGFQLQAGVEYSFEMYAFVPGLDGNFDEFKVAIGREASPLGLTEVIMDYTKSNARSLLWERVRVNFTATETGIHYFGIHYCTRTKGGYNALAFDNIALYQQSATPEVRANILAPIFPYTISPEFLAVPATDIVRVAVENRSKNDLTDMNTTIRIEKNQSEFFSETTSRLGVLAFAENLAMFQTSQPITFDKPTSTTVCDEYKIFADFTSVDGLNQTVSATFNSPLLSENLYARDNGIVTLTYGVENTVALFGMAFNFVNHVTLHSAIFRLHYPTGSGTRLSQVLVWRVPSGGGVVERVGGYMPFYLIPMNEVEEYEIRLSARSDRYTDLLLERGLYFVTITQPAAEGVRLGLLGTSTVSSGITGVYSIGDDFERLNEVFYLRLMLSEADELSFPPNASVFSPADSFDLRYTAHFTSVAMFNIAGQMISSYELPATGQFSIPTHNLVRGVYILQFRGSNVTEAVKVMR